MKLCRKSVKAFVSIFCIINILQMAVFADVSSKEDFETKVTYGFNKYYKSNSNIQTPIKVEVKNNSKDIEGEVQILFEKHRFDKKILYETYKQELDLKKGATKTINMNIFIGNRRQAIFRIVDSKENVLFEEKIKLAQGDNPKNVSIGILSDNYDSLSFLSSIQLYEEQSAIEKKTTSIADLNGAFPKEKELLKSLNIIVINDYDTQNLDKNQIEALKDYIKEGGTLIVGTGSKYQKNLKGLKDISYFVPKETVQIQSFKTNKGRTFTGNSMIVASGEVDGGEVFLKQGDMPIAYNKKLKNGNIVILGFDLSEESFLNWGEKQEFIKDILFDYTNVDISQIKEYNDYYRVEEITRYIPNQDGIKGKTIVIMILIFLLVVGPINYILLKKLDKSDKAWISIPIISLIFTIFIYLIGLGTRFDKSMANNVAIIELNSEGQTSENLIYTGVFGFKEGDLKVSFDENTSINLDSDTHRYINHMKFKDEDTVVEYNLDKQKYIVFKKVGRWQSETINLNEKVEEIDIRVEDFKINDKEVLGKIKNNSGLNLEDTVLIYGETYYSIGDINKKVTEDIKIDANKFKKIKGSGSPYGISDSIYPSTNDIHIEKESLLNKSIKSEILQQALGKYLQQDNDIAMMIAWNKEPIISDIKINNKVPNRVDRNLIIIPLEISYKQGEEVSIPSGVLRAKIEELDSLRMDGHGRDLYGDGSVVYSLGISDSILIESMDIDMRSSPDVNLYVYNYNTNEWQESNRKKLNINKDNIEDYYREETGVRVKFEGESGKDNSISEPVFSVKGVGK